MGLLTSSFGTTSPTRIARRSNIILPVSCYLRHRPHYLLSLEVEDEIRVALAKRLLYYLQHEKIALCVVCLEPGRNISESHIPRIVTNPHMN